jgi:hypothetical protein
MGRTFMKLPAESESNCRGIIIIPPTTWNQYLTNYPYINLICCLTNAFGKAFIPPATHSQMFADFQEPARRPGGASRNRTWGLTEGGRHSERGDQQITAGHHQDTTNGAASVALPPV